ncbi:MAG TPA: sulfotransferase domain-containing protein [Ktedonobacteraceae bacterium]|nr:sulfotransferase domain-containing protein [Ktedonobacteraceae bacterium]
MATIDRHILEKAFRATTNPLRLMPDFIIIGTMRGGTTSLYSYLTDHPSIGPAYMKEVHFFDVYYHKGLHWYRSQFPSSVQKYYSERVQKQQFITGEASPYYLFHPHAPKRIARVLPQVKLVVLLRNPVNRAYSHYYHELAGGYETLSFEEAIRREEERIGKEAKKLAKNEQYISYSHRHYSYLARGIYVDQLKIWMDLFPREQFLILKSEDFYTDPASGLKQCLEFVNIAEVGLKEHKEEYERLNTTKPPRMDPETRKRLVEYFEPHNARLYEYLGADFGWDK